MTLGEKIKQLRFNKNMTQDELAAKIGATKGSISNYEKNKRVPHFPVISAIAGVFDINVDELLSCMDADGENIKITTPEKQLDNIQVRRVKKLTAAFIRLSEETQLKVIGYIEEISRIPAYQRTLSSVFIQYILNTYMLSYAPLNETEEQAVFEDPLSESKRYWIVDIKHIVLQNIVKQKEKHWHFLYCSCSSPIDSESIVKQILKSIDYPTEFLDDFSFVFDDMPTLNMFYTCFETMRKVPPTLSSSQRPDYKFFVQAFSFILINKETREIIEVKELPPKGSTDVL